VGFPRVFRLHSAALSLLFFLRAPEPLGGGPWTYACCFLIPLFFFEHLFSESVSLFGNSLLFATLPLFLDDGFPLGVFPPPFLIWVREKWPRCGCVQNFYPSDYLPLLPPFHPYHVNSGFRALFFERVWAFSGPNSGRPPFSFPNPVLSSVFPSLFRAELTSPRCRPLTFPVWLSLFLPPSLPYVWCEVTFPPPFRHLGHLPSEFRTPPLFFLPPHAGFGDTDLFHCHVLFLTDSPTHEFCVCPSRDSPPLACPHPCTCLAPQIFGSFSRWFPKSALFFPLFPPPPVQFVSGASKSGLGALCSVPSVHGSLGANMCWALPSRWS